MEKNPKVSIVVVSFNTLSYTKACIDSVYKYVKLPFELIVVDNGSKDGSQLALKKDKRIRLIQNKKNLGFAAANNQAIKIAKGRYVLLLNSDTLFASDAVSPSIAFLANHPDVAIVTCRLKSKNNITQQNGGYFPTHTNILFWMMGIDDLPFFRNLVHSYHPKLAFYDGDKEIDWATGAFMLIDKEKLRGECFLDEDYFMYVEDMDLCFRAKKMGYKTYYLHKTEIFHIGGASSSSENSLSKFALLNEAKNMILFSKKHLSLFSQIFFKVFILLGMLMRAVAYVIIGKFGNANLYAKIIKNILTGQ